MSAHAHPDEYLFHAYASVGFCTLFIYTNIPLMKRLRFKQPAFRTVRMRIWGKRSEKSCFGFVHANSVMPVPSMHGGQLFALRLGLYLWACDVSRLLITCADIYKTSLDFVPWAYSRIVWMGDASPTFGPGNPCNRALFGYVSSRSTSKLPARGLRYDHMISRVDGYLQYCQMSDMPTLPWTEQLAYLVGLTNPGHKCSYSKWVAHTLPSHRNWVPNLRYMDLRRVRRHWMYPESDFDMDWLNDRSSEMENAAPRRWQRHVACDIDLSQDGLSATSERPRYLENFPMALWRGKFGNRLLATRTWRIQFSRGHASYPAWNFVRPAQSASPSSPASSESSAASSASSSASTSLSSASVDFGMPYSWERDFYLGPLNSFSHQNFSFGG